MDSVTIDFNIIKEVGITKAAILCYVYTNRDRLEYFYGSLIISVLPMSRSNVYKAIEDLVTDTYLDLHVSKATQSKGSRKTYSLSKTFFNKFPDYAKPDTRVH